MSSRLKGRTESFGMPRSPVLKMGSTTAGSEEPVPLTLHLVELLVSVLGSKLMVRVSFSASVREAATSLGLARYCAPRMGIMVVIVDIL